MSARRLEEILEECLSAYLDGRRSVEESLSLYPFYASELEPMLRTATGISYALNSYSPPLHVQQRGLQRFLSDARARRNLKALKVGSVQPSRFAITWQKYRLGFAGAAMAVVILAAAVGGTAILGGDDGSGNIAFKTDSATPAVLTNLQQEVSTIRSLSASQSLTAEDIVRLRAATEALENAPDSEIDAARESIEQALNDANALVTEIIATQDPALAQPAQDAQDTIRDVASGLEVVLVSPTPVADTATPEPTTEPTITPTEEPTPTPEPTVAPTEAPTPTLPPPPSESPPPRAPA
jgi:hypothetical protein